LFNPATDGLENVVNIVISDQVRVEYVRQMIFLGIFISPQIAVQKQREKNKIRRGI